jgi:hypothetical protein
MGLGKNYKTALPSIKVWLYQNYLPNADDGFFARTANEAILDIDKICESMKDRGGFAGKYEDLVANVKHFMDESAYMLCCGFGLNLGYFSLYPNIGGTFSSKDEERNKQKHPVTVHYRTLSKFRKMLNEVSVVVLGEATNDSTIKLFLDHDKDSVNKYAPGNLFSITGVKIKLAGDDPDCGVFFVPVDNPEAAVKVTRFSENSRKKISGVAPDTGYQFNRIEVRTQYCGSDKLFLKGLRIISTRFVVEAAA